MHETANNKLVGLIRQLNIEHYYDDGTPLYYTRDGRAGSQFKAKKGKLSLHCSMLSVSLC